MLPLGLTFDMTLKGEVTGVNSNVGMPLTRLVQYMMLNHWMFHIWYVFIDIDGLVQERCC